MGEAAKRQALADSSDFLYFAVMDKTITATEANRSFSRILREVEAGDSFTVTSHGRTVARITAPPKPGSKEAVAEFLSWARKQPIRVVEPWTRDELYER